MERKHGINSLVFRSAGRPKKYVGGHCSADAPLHPSEHWSNGKGVMEGSLRSHVRRNESANEWATKVVSVPATVIRLNKRKERVVNEGHHVSAWVRRDDGLIKRVEGELLGLGEPDLVLWTWIANGTQQSAEDAMSILRIAFSNVRVLVLAEVRLARCEAEKIEM